MQINNKYIKILFKLLISIAIVECVYLFAVPSLIEKCLFTDNLKQAINTKTNILLDYKKPKIKTHILPYISLSMSHLSITDKSNNSLFFEADNINTSVRLFPLFIKKLNIREISLNNAYLNLKRDKNGIFNFERLFPKQVKKLFDIKINSSEINADNINITSLDEQTRQKTSINKMPLTIITNAKRKNILIISKGQINTKKNTSEFDINLESSFPFDTKNIEKNQFAGNLYAYNINLKDFRPYFKKYVDNKITNLDGFIEYLQVSADKTETDNICLNTSFSNVVFNKSNWKNHINAKGKNKVDANIKIKNKKIDLISFKYLADDVNIKSHGSVILNKKPELDISVEVSKSRAENIAPLLPPTLVPSTMIIEKVKSYGVYGDVNGKIRVKGTVPQPDITGYVIGNNVQVLDQELHKLHKGTVKLNFDKRILDMDILVEMFNNQHAKVFGTINMFRDGINNVTVKTTDNIDFPLAQKIIIPVSNVFNFQLGPIPDMNITSGKGNIDLNIQGSPDFIKLNGYSNFDNAKLTYKDLYGEVQNGKGRIDFKDDVISFKSERAFVKDNPLSVNGDVQINNHLDVNISSDYANGVDVLEIINKSKLLKDVKQGVAVITSAAGRAKLAINIKSNIVPVPFGQPPLPPEEAFTDMKVKGNLVLSDNACTIEGFKVPIEKIKGNVDFTETVVNLNNIEGISGTSPIKIEGTIVTDTKTKIPDVDFTVKSNSVNLKDTIKFLTESYLYPSEYPDLSPLYNIASKHDLYFKYKAKSLDFVTDKAYAVMNFIQDNSDSELKATSGKIILDKSTVKVQNVKAKFYDSILSVNGEVNHIDRPIPIYNLSINMDNFNLANLNYPERISILPEKAGSIFSSFMGYKGYSDINFEIKNNIFNGCIKMFHPEFKLSAKEIPFSFDNFNIYIKNNKIILKDIAASIADMPFFINTEIADFYKNPSINGNFTSKIKNSFITNYLPKEVDDLITLSGDISLSARFNGNKDGINIYPKLVMHQNADMEAAGMSLGEVSDTREFSGKVQLKKNSIIVDKLDYIKYISSQNNKAYPVLFATGSGILNIEKDNKLELEEINVKTNNNLSAKILNIFLKTPIFEYGTFNCDLKYKFNKSNKIGYLKGIADCRNLDIPLFDTIVKNIRITADKDINISLIGFMNDSKFNIFSVLDNNLYETPKFHSIKISADEIDGNKLFKSLSETQKAMKTNNKIKNTSFSGLNIENGYIDIKKYVIKSLVAENLTSTFSIDDNDVFKASNINVDVNQGKIIGDLEYNLNSNKMKGDFELNNVDSNYVAETLFDGKNQIYGKANGKIILESQGLTNEEIIKNLSGFVYFDISDGRMPKLGSLEYLLHASNIIKSGITGFTLNNILELLNLVKTGYFSNINGSCSIRNGIAENIEIFSTGENLSLYIHGKYDIKSTSADMEILGKLSKKISTIFGAIGNTSLNTFFKFIPGISMLDFGRKNFVDDVEKIPSFTHGDYDSRTFQAIINGDINASSYVQSFKWVK